MNKCPICYDENHCGLVEGKQSCWCMNLTIPDKVLTLTGGIKDRCICKTCIQKNWEKGVRT